LPPDQFYTFFDKGSRKPASTTMVCVNLLRRLMKYGEFGKRVVPMITDEARTFGINAIFHEFKIHAPAGQHYTPVDHDQLMKYSETPDGQILQEGISEAQALATWIASGTSYASQGSPTLPFYMFYSMFGFQRVGDSIWQAADARARGFILGATSGRTTLNGEGLQHQDGHSLLIALTNPAVVAWDPAFGYELAHIIKHGIEEMWGKEKDKIYYIALYNENIPMPALPAEVDPDDILKGLYKFKSAQVDAPETVRLIGSGSMMPEILRARDILKTEKVSTEVWSAPNYGDLYREALECERQGRLNPLQPPPKSWVEECLGDYDGVTVVASDYQAAYPQLIRPYVGGDFIVLGTDGFGRSDTRKALRRFFEVDAEHIVIAALSGLSRQGKFPAETVMRVMNENKITPERVDIAAQ